MRERLLHFSFGLAAGLAGVWRAGGGIGCAGVRVAGVGEKYTIWFGGAGRNRSLAQRNLAREFPARESEGLNLQRDGRAVRETAKYSFAVKSFPSGGLCGRRYNRSGMAGGDAADSNGCGKVSRRRGPVLRGHRRAPWVRLVHRGNLRASRPAPTAVSGYGKCHWRFVVARP